VWRGTAAPHKTGILLNSRSPGILTYSWSRVSSSFETLESRSGRGHRQRVAMLKAIHFQNDRRFENYRDLLMVLLQKEIKVRYKDKFLGYLWSVANPLSFGLVYFFVFSVIMQVKVENYPLILMSGLFPWQWLSNSVNSSPKLFIGNASILKKINFPKNILSLAIALNHMIHFIFSIPVILLFLFIYHRAPSWSWLYGIPVLLIVQLTMIYGISLFLGTINLFIRDFERLTHIVMRFVFYLTPIVYPLELIPDRYKTFITFNPAGTLIITWRELILNGTLDLAFLLYSSLYALMFFFLGYSVYRRFSSRFAEVL
jgi:lipopolysaccharide transport system permease protein